MEKIQDAHMVKLHHHEKTNAYFEQQNNVFTTKVLGLFQLLFVSLEGLFATILDNCFSCSVGFVLLRMVVPTHQPAQIQKTHFLGVTPSNVTLWSLAAVGTHPPFGRPCLGSMCGSQATPGVDGSCMEK